MTTKRAFKVGDIVLVRDQPPDKHRRIIRILDTGLVHIAPLEGVTGWHPDSLELIREGSDTRSTGL